MKKKLVLTFTVILAGLHSVYADNNLEQKSKNKANIQANNTIVAKQKVQAKKPTIPSTQMLPAPELKNNNVVLDAKQQIPEKPPLDHSKWSFFQIGFLPLFPSFTKVSNVYGIKIGAPMCSGYGRVYGIEPSLLYSGTRYVSGIQATFWGTCISREVYGIQAASFGPSITGTIYGLQADGTLGMAEEVVGAQIAPVTLCAGDLTGIQFGVLNLSKKGLTGFQGGAVNVSAVTTGLQFGVVNYSDVDGFQIGGINIIRNGWLPFMIGINFKF